MTNTFIIKFEMDDLSYIEREYANVKVIDELKAEARRWVDEYATWDWTCCRVAIGFKDDDDNFQEIIGVDYSEPTIISEDFCDKLAEDDDFDDYDEPDFDLDFGFDPYEGCYTWDC